MPDDTELLRRYARDGSEEAFTELVARHLNLVYSVALRRVGGDAHLAKDVTQQVFIALARQAAALSGRPVLAGWLYTTSRFVSAQVVRAARRRQAREQEAQLMQYSSASVPDPDWDRLRPVLDEVMDRLSDHDREALLLRFFEGQPFAAVSEKLGLTEEATRKRVDRALDKLRAMLARRGIGSTTAAVALMLENQAVTAAPAGLTTTVAGSALSAGSGINLSTLSLLQLMSTTKLTVSLAVLGAFFAIGLATYEIHASRETSVALALANRDNDALLAHLGATNRSAQSSEKSLADLQKAIDAARAVRAAEDAKAAAEAAKVRDPVAAGHEFLSAHPEAPTLVTTEIRANMIKNYAPLFKSLGLSSDQIEQFLDLMVREQAGLRWDSDTQSPIGEFDIGDLSKVERENKLHELLGDDGYHSYQEFDRTRTARELAAQLGSSAYFTAAPLTTVQASQLVQILSQSSADYQQGKSVSASSIEWDAAITRAQDVLSASQLVALGDLRDQNLFSQEMHQAINETVKAFVASRSPSSASK
jgi:RNA polymerase sigma factor (sigma-70 family)